MQTETPIEGAVPRRPEAEARARAQREQQLRDQSAALAERVKLLGEIGALVGHRFEGLKKPSEEAVRRLREIGHQLATTRPPRTANGGDHG
jgi:hypothetical protein